MGGGLIHNFFTLFTGALALNDDVFVVARDAPRALAAALIIAFIAGCSNTLGRSVILFANRVPRERFAGTVLLIAVVYVGRLVVWCLSTWLVARLLFGQMPFRTALLIILLGQAPQVFSFLVMSPYLGSTLRRVLDVYSLIVVVDAAGAMIGATIGRTLLCVGVGWLIVVVLADLLERPLAGVRTWMLHSPSGQMVPDAEAAIRQQLLAPRN